MTFVSLFSPSEDVRKEKAHNVSGERKPKVKNVIFILKTHHIHKPEGYFAK